MLYKPCKISSGNTEITNKEKNEHFLTGKMVKYQIKFEASKKDTKSAMKLVFEHTGVYVVLISICTNEKFTKTLYV